MEAKELRIGNLLTVGNYYVKVIEVHHLGVQVCDLEQTQDTWEQYDDRIKPIPLTEEWLLKFGFETDILKTKVLYYNTIPYFVLTKGLKRDGYPFRLNGYKNYPRPLHYVHQLQNLYYSLTGKEI